MSSTKKTDAPSIKNVLNPRPDSVWKFTPANDKFDILVSSFLSHCVIFYFW